MNFKRIVVLLVFAAICVPQANAQWDTQLSQYWATRTYYNPAFAGQSNGLELTALDRLQWVGIDNAPKTFIFAADMPLTFLGRTNGVGILAQTEKIGLFTNTLMGVQYVFRQKMGVNRLNIGLQIGMANIGFDASGIHVPDDQKNDVIVPTGTGSKVFDANLGLTWIAPKYYVGLSSTHVGDPQFNVGDNTSSYIARTYYLTAGYNIKFSNPLYELQPSILFKTDAVVTQYDVTARLVYAKTFNAGITWRKDAGFIFLLGASLGRFEGGYAYDMASSTLAKVSSGSHEFYLRYRMPIVQRKRTRNIQKSVRLL